MSPGLAFPVRRSNTSGDGVGWLGLDFARITKWGCIRERLAMWSSFDGSITERKDDA